MAAENSTRPESVLGLVRPVQRGFDVARPVRHALDAARPVVWHVLVVLVVAFLLLPVTAVAGQELSRRASVTSVHVMGLGVVEPGVAGVLCTSWTIDPDALRDAIAIMRLAAERFATPGELSHLHFDDHGVFVAPRGPGLDKVRPATFEITFNDFPREAEPAFFHAVDLWSALITSNVPIRIEANWTSMEPNVLGSAGPRFLHADFGAGIPGTWYADALADAMAGRDLNPGEPDVVANLNSDFDTWYFGTDGRTPAGHIDLVSVVMHEIGHAIGFLGSMRVDDGSEAEECAGVAGEACWGLGGPPVLPVIYDRFAEDEAGRRLVSESAYANPSTALAGVLRGGPVVFNGPAAVAGHSGLRPPLHAPANWNPLSSYSHLDGAAFPRGDPSSLMTPSIRAAEAVHDPGPVGCGIFADMGWTTTGSCAVDPGTEPDPEPPDQFVLHQNFPNPFNPSTRIRFSVPEPVDATLSIYDAIGRVLVVLHEGSVVEGTHEVTWESAGVPSGVYAYRLRAGAFEATRMMVLVR